ncbi:MAG: hypothetical protein ACTHV8_10520 [Nesterenkonia sp.]
MPDKPLETTWVGTMLLPTLRRGRRFGRRLLRGARSRVLPRTGVLGDLPFSLPAASPLRPDAAAAEVRRLDVVVLTVPEESDQIPADYLEPLILAEQHSVPTVLVVAGAEEVKTPLAAVVTHLVTADPQLVAVVDDFAGAERRALLDAQASAGTRAAVLRRLTGVHTPVAKR